MHAHLAPSCLRCIRDRVASTNSNTSLSVRVGPQHRCSCGGAPEALPSLRHTHLLACMATLNGGGVHTSRNSVKRPGQELDRNQRSGSGSANEAPEEDAIVPVPLKFVVQEAVRRWFEDTIQEAARGDVKQQALVGQMYAEGYGVAKDLKAAKEWTDKASARGYRMQGVYCEL